MKRFFVFTTLMILCFQSFNATAQTPPDTILPTTNYIHIRSGLSNAFHHIENKKATVAFLGGSITNMEGWRHLTCDYLQAQFPATNFTFINAGIPSLGSLPHAFRLTTDLPNLKNVDLLFVEAAVNDHANSTDSLTQLLALEGIIRQAKKANAEISIMMIEFADQDKNKDYDEHKTPLEIENHEKIAAYYNVASINLAKLVHDKMENNEFSWEKDFKDLHPAPFGQQLYFSVIKDALIKGFATDNSKHSTLPKPLNKENFEHGYYGKLTDAKLSKEWKLIPNWKPSDSLETRAGFVNVPVLKSDSAGAILEYSFTGNAIGLGVLSGPDAGIIEYSIDGNPFKKKDMFTQWSKSLYLPWYILLQDGLRAGKHVLKLRLSNEKNKESNGNTCRIVHFLVNG